MPFAEINRRLHDEVGYYLTQTIGTERRLGDVGYYTEDDGFNRRETLNNLGIQFDTREDEQPTDYQFEGGRGVTQSVSVAGEPVGDPFKTITEAGAGVRLEFDTEASYAISIKGARELSISSKNKIAKALKEAETEYPDANNAIVSRVMTAESTTVLISGSSDAAVELRADASVEVADFSIANLDASFEISYSKDMGIKQVGKRGATPLYDLTTLEEDSDWGLIPSIFSLSPSTTIAHTGRPSRNAESAESGGDLTQSEAEELLRSVRPDELTSGDSGVKE